MGLEYVASVSTTQSLINFTDMDILFIHKSEIQMLNFIESCLETINSGEGSSINGSFIVGESVTAGSAYTYNVCPCNDNICRIRFDFTVSNNLFNQKVLINQLIYRVILIVHFQLLSQLEFRISL